MEYDTKNATIEWKKKIKEEEYYLEEIFPEEEIYLPWLELEHVTGFNIPEAGYYE